MIRGLNQQKNNNSEAAVILPGSYKKKCMSFKKKSVVSDFIIAPLTSFISVIIHYVFIKIVPHVKDLTQHTEDFL